MCADWVGVRRRLVQKTNIGRGDTTFLARYNQRRGGARAGVAQARRSLPRATASRKYEREKRSRDREIRKNNFKTTREQGSEILARESSKDLVCMFITYYGTVMSCAVLLRHSNDGFILWYAGGVGTSTVL